MKNRVSSGCVAFFSPSPSLKRTQVSLSRQPSSSPNGVGSRLTSPYSCSAAWSSLATSSSKSLAFRSRMAESSPQTFLERSALPSELRDPPRTMRSSSLRFSS
ncbi:MAG: hypothetical protein QM765_51420 [Myxococcales bacterium]